VEFWKNRIWGRMEDQIQFYRGASVVDPNQFLQLEDAHGVLSLLKEKEEVVQGRNGQLRKLCGLKGMSQTQMEDVIAELPEYQAMCEAVVPNLQLIPPAELPSAVWQWWWIHRDELPSLFTVAAKLLLCPPSSAAVERLFSEIKGATSKKQASELDSTLTLRCKTRYNMDRLDALKE